MIFWWKEREKKRENTERDSRKRTKREERNGTRRERTKRA